jgi:regulator of replication initiation timing
LTCPNYQKLTEKIQELAEENAQLREENAQLKRRLAYYENPNTPPSRRMYPSRKHKNCVRRFPGRPKGHKGKSRPQPKPDVVKVP